MERRALNIIGCGKVGRTLARLWHEAGIFTIGGIVNRSEDSARQAAAFIGAGVPFKEIGALPPSDLTMIAANDDDIASLAAELAKRHDLADRIVFHCSGALPSSALEAAKKAGAFTASVHPVKSFADPAKAVRTFSGTWCGVEGDAAALAVLEPAFASSGAHVFPVDPERKIFYHAGAVFVCNYLTALMEAGLRCYERAGVPRGMALEMTQPIIDETLRNIRGKGTAAALTGPLARGDAAVYARQLQALKSWDADMAALYEQLGSVAADLAAQKRMAA